MITEQWLNNFYVLGFFLVLSLLTISYIEALKIKWQYRPIRERIYPFKLSTKIKLYLRRNK